MTAFTGREAIQTMLETIDSWLSEPVSLYLIGGTAMTAEGLKDQTEDIDLAFAVASEFEHVYQTLQAHGFDVVNEPTAAFEGTGRTVELRHEGRGLLIDLFEQQVVAKARITRRMHDRTTTFWVGEHAAVYVLSDEDMFLLKAVSGGDLGSGRHRDIEDMRTYALRGLDYNIILDEIEAQRPFNEGDIEARQIRDRSHPLFAIDVAVSSLSGLPNTFESSIESIGTEFEVEYTVLGAVDDDITSVDRISDRVNTSVETLSKSPECMIHDAIDRLVAKRVLERDGDTIQPR